MPVLKRKKKVYSSRWAIRLGWLEDGAFLRPKRLLLLFVTGLEDFQREFHEYRPLRWGKWAFLTVSLVLPSWSVINKLTINIGKTKEIVFHRSASRHLNIPPPLLGIERVTETTLLGIDITSTLSTYVYVNRLLMQINQRMYLLSQLKSQGMNVQALQTLFTGLIMSKITYALPSFAGQLTADDKNRIGAISRKAQ